jgi:hypothetical protein
MQVRWCVCVLLAAAVTGFAQDRPLGDVAREHRQQKDASRTAKRVIDNDTLPHASASEAMNGAVVGMKVAAQQNAPTPAANSTATPAVAPGDALKRLEEVKAAEAAARRAVKKFEMAAADDSISSERRETFENGLHDAKQLLAEATKERETLEQALTPAPQTNANGADTKDAQSTEAKPDAKANGEEKQAEAKSDAKAQDANDARHD